MYRYLYAELPEAVTAGKTASELSSRSDENHGLGQLVRVKTDTQGQKDDHSTDRFRTIHCSAI